MNNDVPVAEDRLERKALIREVGDRVVTSPLPQVFGISGDWGSGKTSFLRQLQRYVTGACALDSLWKPEEGDCHCDREYVTVVWFEAWRYQHEPMPIVALLHEIREQLPMAAKALNEGNKLFDVAVRTAFSLFDQTIKDVKLSGLLSAQTHGEKWESDRHYVPLGTETIRKQLQHALNQILSGGLEQILPEGVKEPPKRRLVVLVDDLDRCTPEAAYKLLEGMKIYLNLENCAFVLGMNQGIIEQGIAKQFTAIPVNAQIAAREYLEKICQNIWHLPLITNPAGLLESYFEDLLESRLMRDGAGSHALRKQLFQNIVVAVREFSALQPNARKIKAFGNLLDRFADRYIALPAHLQAERDAKILIVFAYLYQNCQPVYRILQREQDFYNQKLLVWARTAPSERKLHPTLDELLPVARFDSDSGVEEVWLGATEFPDPVQEGYLRVQQLIFNLRELTETEYPTYLLNS